MAQDTSNEAMLHDISGRQLRAARALLGWSRDELAGRSSVALNTIKRYEAGRAILAPQAAALVRALRAGGVAFIKATEVDDQAVVEGVALVLTRKAP